MVALTHLVCFRSFLTEMLLFWPPILVYCFCGLFVWVVSLLAGARTMSPQLRKVNYRPITDRKPKTSVFSKVLQGLMSISLRRVAEYTCLIPATKFAYRKGLGTCDALLWVSHTWQSAWRVGGRIGSRRLISEQALIGWSISEFPISSYLCVLQVCDVYADTVSKKSNSQRHVNGCQSKLVNVVSGVLQRSVFGPVVVPLVHLGAVFHSGEWADRLYQWLHFDGCCAISRC